MTMCHPRMSPTCQIRRIPERSQLNGVMSCELAKLRLSASTPVVLLLVLLPIMFAARKPSSSNCPSSNLNAISVESLLILMLLSVWYVAMYICKPFLKSFFQSTSWLHIEVLSRNSPAGIESTVLARSALSLFRCPSEPQIVLPARPVVLGLVCTAEH